jgi:hypothetical protein
MLAVLKCNQVKVEQLLEKKPQSNDDKPKPMKWCYREEKTKVLMVTNNLKDGENGRLKQDL